MRKITAEQLVIAVMHDIEGVEDEVDQIIQVSAKYGRDLVKEYISTRPSEKSGKAGRIDTGAMLRSATYRRLGKGSARFGMAGGPEWATYQEHGFVHNRSGEWVKGMFAVTDAYHQVSDDIQAALRRIR